MLVHQNFGGQLLALRTGLDSFFYLSPLTTKGATVRGGIPVCFPQFANNGHLPKHGFVRDLPWDCVESSPELVRYQLQITESTHPNWTHAAQLEISYQCTDVGLSVGLDIHNVGKTPFAFTGGLHPYLRINQLQSVSIAGLAGLKTDNLYFPKQIKLDTDALCFDDHAFETCFEGCPTLLIYEQEKLSFRLSSVGFTHWMVWNPGKEGAKGIKDLPDSDWQRFICVEPIIREPMVLQPRSSFKGILEIKRS